VRQRRPSAKGETATGGVPEIRALARDARDKSLRHDTDKQPSRQNEWATGQPSKATSPSACSPYTCNSENSKGGGGCPSCRAPHGESIYRVCTYMVVFSSGSSWSCLAAFYYQAGERSEGKCHSWRQGRDHEARLGTFFRALGNRGERVLVCLTTPREKHGSLRASGHSFRGSDKPFLRQGKLKTPAPQCRAAIAPG